MFCKNCGKELPDNATFCSGCGEQLKPVSKSKYEGGKPLEDGKVPFVAPVPPIKPDSGVDAPMYTNEPEPQEENKSKKGIIVAIIAIIIAIALIVGGFFLIKYMKDEKSDDDDKTKSDEIVTRDSEITGGSYTTDPNNIVTVPTVTEIVTDENGEIVTNANGEAVTVVRPAVKPEVTTKPDATEVNTTKPGVTTPATTKPNTTKPATEVTTKPAVTNPTTTKPATTTPSSPSNWTNQQILDLYNSAVKKTDPKAPKGNSKFALVGGITGDGAIGSIAEIITPIITKALAQNSIPTDFVPGSGNITASDIKSIKISETGSTYIIEMTIKDQTDNAFASSSSGPVGRAIGTFGNITSAISDLGINLNSGIDTVKINYTDAKIKAVIDKNSGLITSGNWHYLASVSIAEANASISVITAALKNVNLKIDYTVVI